jgi:putative membrane protein
MTTTFLDLVASGNGDHGWWIVWPFVWLAAIGALVWLVLRRRRGDGPAGVDRAREILAERFARGELTVDEYRERLGQL